MAKLTLLLFLLAFPLTARAQLGSLFGLGPRQSGMGGVSLFQGRPTPFQAFSAPASLGFLRAVEISAGAVYFDPRLKPFGTLVLNSSGNTGKFDSAGVLPGGGQVLAMAIPIGRERPLTIGGAIYLPFSTLIRVSGNPVNFPFYPLYNDISRNFFFVVGAGYEIIDGLALGMNLRSTTKSSTVYTLRADGSVNYSATATEAKGESRVSVSAVYDNERRNGGRPFSVGAMYRARAGLETKIAADVTYFVPISGQLTSLPSYSPAEWVLMGSWRFADRWTVSADGAWVKWSGYTSPYGSGNINTYVIGSNQRGAGFKDVPVFRVGVDRRSPQNGRWLKSLNLRGGYLHYPSPAPDQTGDSNFVDCDRHLFSVGAGLGVRNPWKEGDLIDFDLFTQYNWLVDREIKKLSALNVGAPGYTAGGHIWMYGAGVTMKF